MAEKNQSFVDSIRGRLQKFLGVQPKTSTEWRPAEHDLMQSMMTQGWRELYNDIISGRGTRANKYDRYKFLDQNLAEACAVLNVYADNIVSGTIGGEENYYVMIDEKTKNIKNLEQMVSDAEKQSNIKDQIWDLSRNLLRDGDEFCEVVVANKDGNLTVDKLKSLPKKEIEANVDQYGSFKDPAFPYVQKVVGAIEPAIKFDWWRIIHFKIGNDVYGVDKGLFANAALRVGRQLLWVDESLVLARMSRAWKRHAFFVNTEGMSPDDAFAFVDKFMKRLKQKIVVDKTTGQTTVSDAPLMPDEDIGIPVGKDVHADVKELSGDSNISNIKDVDYLQNKFFMVTTCPKAYVAKEQDINARATQSFIDVQFARQVRRRQQSLIPGLRQYYRLVFILAGVDPESFEWSIVFPELATSDEMMKWEMMQVKANVAKALAVDIGVVNDEYVWRELLDFDDDMIAKYGVKMTAPKPGDQTMPDMIQLPPETAMLVRRDPHVRAILDDLKDLVYWKMNREKEMAGKVPVGVGRKESLRDGRN